MGEAEKHAVRKSSDRAFHEQSRELKCFYILRIYTAVAAAAPFFAPVLNV